MLTIYDFLILSKSFIRYILKSDYFRQRQELGNYFQDPRCYYNDLRGKTKWKGPSKDGVPILFYPAINKYVISPCRILNYGLGRPVPVGNSINMVGAILESLSNERKGPCDPDGLRPYTVEYSTQKYLKILLGEEAGPNGVMP